MSYFFNPEARAGKELVPGVVARTFWGEQMLVSLVDLAAGAVVPAHSHPHEQTGVMLRGTMQVTIAGETRTMQAGDTFIVPGGVEHSVVVGVAGAQAVDVFSPVREDYKFPD